ncbi:ABC transporter ATP-binding protein [Chelativorans sp. AA-79]|uniref:ABC transporter ATP-binding protein n=1 Tax=Chelativorans sp. AA-79 TaxID=3028735 RepID=UPI0023F8CF02|nr:ABC transporter ATP-binding protein [Chelativorans sp. AA-79]WEX11174.1 ABC transporter ATP-binding protein [Chelativorans sp. AA-79]
MEGLVLSGLGRRFGDVDAVLDVDLALKPGEFVSLLGPSGCGKTTTLRMIAGFIDPTSGSISLNGSVLSAPGGSLPPEKRGMSMIFQSYAIWPNMTVAQNVAFGLKLRKLPAEEIKRRVGEILEVVQLNTMSGRYPSELSGGQQQRVALARAVVVRPAVLLLDEPLSNLDANLREEMRFEIKRIHDEFRITSVYVTHDQGEAMVTSDRIAVMNQGRIEQVDAPYALYTKPKTRFVASFIGRTNFLIGRKKDNTVDFEGFSVPSALLDVPAGADKEVSVSIRPQSLKLCGKEPDASDHVKLKGKVVERAFMGETWDYMFAGENSIRLRVVAPPSDVFQIGAETWVQMDPSQIVPIS